MTEKKPLSEAVQNFLDSLPADIGQRVEELRGIQQRCNVVRSDFLKEKRELEEKYRKLFDPLFSERAQLVIGEGGIPQANGEKYPQDPGAVPGFWLRVLKSATMIGDHVTHRDEHILKYLLDLTAEPLEDGAVGFKLVFKFAPNHFFSPLTLEKRYYLSGEDESQLDRTEGTDIVWNPDKNPAYKVVKKKPKGNQPPKTKLMQTHSFFDFFTPPEIPDPAEDDEISDIAELLAEDDLELGCYIKEIVVPNAVSWYTGELPGSEEEDEDGDSESSSEEYVTTEED